MQTQINRKPVNRLPARKQPATTIAVAPMQGDFKAECCVGVTVVSLLVAVLGLAQRPDADP